MALEKDNAARLVLRSYASLQLKRYSEASSLAREALKIRANYATAHHLNAVALRGLGNFKDAQYAVTQAINQEPDNPRHTLLLAILLFLSGDIDEAEKKFKEILRADPENTDYQIYYCVFLIRQKKFDEATPLTRELREKRPDDQRIRLLHGCAKTQEYRPELDEVRYRPPLPIDSNDPASYVELGKLFFELGYYDKATAELDRALMRDPQNTEAQRLIATIFKVKNNKVFQILWNYSFFILSPLVMTLVVFALVGLGFASFSSEFHQKELGALTLLFLILLIGLPLWISRGASADEYKAMEEDRLIEDIPEEDILAEQKTSEKELDSITRIQMDRKSKLYKSLNQVFLALATFFFIAIFFVVNIDRVFNFSTQPFYLKLIKLVCAIFPVLFLILAYYFDKKSKKLSQS